jgi:hypothetical protein
VVPARPSYHPPRKPVWIFWLYLLSISTIEAFTLLSIPQFGLLAHGVLLLVLTLHSGLGRSGEARSLALVLTLIPLTRMLALALPLMNLPQSSWYPLVALPVLLAAYVVVRQLGISPQTAGLHGRNITFHLMMMSGGIGVGTVQYFFFQTDALTDTFSWDGILLPIVLLIMLTGFTEELIFRGLLQTMARRVMGRWALIYGALAFAVLHIAYLSTSVVLFAFLTGLLFAVIFDCSRSILGVALVNGTASVTHLVILPAFTSYVAESDGMARWLSFMERSNPEVILVMLALMTVGLAAVLVVLGCIETRS